LGFSGAWAWDRIKRSSRKLPVVGLETWGLIAPQGQAPAEITIARTPEAAVAEALRLIAKTNAGLKPR
jgi:hypothetical protein